MGKCTITFEDGEEHGQVETNVEFTPDMENPLNGGVPTPAQNMGWQMFKGIMESMGHSLDDDDS